MTKVYVPASGLDDWRKRLADPVKHWRDDYSAKLTAEAWHSADGFPHSIASAFQAAGNPLDSLSPLLVLPEHQVAIPPDGARPAQSDVWVLASHSSGLTSIAVEGKKEESFGPTLNEWLVDASPGKAIRLAFLTKSLGLPANLPGSTRYQFLHRTASAVIEAQRFHASTAVLLIQSFSDSDTGLPDYNNFIGLFGKSAKPGEFVLLGQPAGIALYAGWVRNAP